MTETTHEAAHETGHLTADAVVFGEGDDGKLRVLMIRRGSPPFTGYLALPGGHLDVGEHPLEAAYRKLREETGLALNLGDLKPVGVYAEPDRDPRGRYVSFAYTVRLAHLPAVTGGDDATEAHWLLVDKVLAPETGIAFDHAQIIRDARRLVDVDETAARGRHRGIVVTNATVTGNGRILIADGDLTVNG